MIKAVKKTLINLSTSWKLFEESSSTETTPQSSEAATLEQKINVAYDALQHSLLNPYFRFYIKHDPEMQTSFIVGRYVGVNGQPDVPEISMTTYASTTGYNGMLLKTVKPGKVDFLQYNVENATEIAITIADYLNLLN